MEKTKNLTEKIIETWLAILTVEYKVALAQNTATPPDVLAALVKDKSDENLIVRFYVAGNPSTPDNTLDELEKDEHEDISVRNAAKREKERRKYFEQKIEVIQDETAVQNSVTKLVNLSVEDKLAFAQNTATPPDVLAALVKDKSKENLIVRLYVAGNPSTPDNTLDELEKDEHEDISVRIVAKNEKERRKYFEHIMYK